LNIEYTIGLGMNLVSKRNSEELLKKAVQQCEQTGQPQRLFTGFDYLVGTWDQPQWGVLKWKANFQGTDRRRPPPRVGIRVNNRPDARTLREGVYDDCSERGETTTATRN